MKNAPQDCDLSHLFIEADADELEAIRLERPTLFEEEEAEAIAEAPIADSGQWGKSARGLIIALLMTRSKMASDPLVPNTLIEDIPYGEHFE